MLFAVLGSALAGLLAGCDTPPVRKIEDAIQDLQFNNRTRGEQQRADAPSVARELGCTPRSGPQVRLDSHEVLPSRPTAGREINHRLVYSACGVGTGATGTLSRKVSHRGRALFEDSERFTLKPGRFAVDAFIGVPAQAQPGVYRIEARFEYRGMSFRSTDDFTVVPR
ncbi:MAG TPA: hypothetical protein PK359_18570 [Burkholderiaceae bacterium]|nr:hypothetical protein [Burkholderiaceae bacterium]